MRQISDRELHEECGVFGVFGVPDAASLSYYGLHALPVSYTHLTLPTNSRV